MRLRELRGQNFEEVTGYCYRETWEGKKQALPGCSSILMDHEIGLMFGPGLYMVAYHYADPTGTGIHTERYNIGPEYEQLHIEHCNQTGQRCYIDRNAKISGMNAPAFQLSDLLNEDKAKGILGLLAAVKMFMAPQGANSEVETLKAVLDGNNKLLVAALGGRGQSGGIPDNLITLLFDRATKPAAVSRESNPLNAFKEQLDIFKEIKILTDPQAAAAAAESEKVESMGPMDKLIEKGLEMLPAVLEKFGGNEAAAAADLKKNFLLRSYLNNPKTAKKFFVAVAADYGQAAAERWAQGFGINPQIFGAAVQAAAAAVPKAAASNAMMSF